MRKTLAKNTAVYYGMITLMDKYIGRILDRLDTLGLRDNTLVVFTTDHGHFLGQHGLVAKGAFHYEDMIRVPFIVSAPGRVPAGRRSSALQSLVDLAPSFLGAAGLTTPADMTGIDQSGVWMDAQASAREHVVVENRHQPTTIHARTYVDARYKLTVYRQRDYGELFDLEEDPGEVRNRWDDPTYDGVKARLTEQLLLAELAKEEPLTEAACAQPQKSAAMYAKTWSNGRYELTVDPDTARFELFDLREGPDWRTNLWNAPEHGGIRTEAIRALLFKRMAGEPLWMPRIAGA